MPCIHSHTSLLYVLDHSHCLLTRSLLYQHRLFVRVSSVILPAYLGLHGTPPGQSVTLIRDQESDSLSCPQLAHQAVQLANGTINWRALYGEEAFRLAPPLYESELQRIRAEKEVDLKDLAEKAKQFATVIPRDFHPQPLEKPNSKL